MLAAPLIVLRIAGKRRRGTFVLTRFIIENGFRENMARLWKPRVHARAAGKKIEARKGSRASYKEGISDARRIVCCHRAGKGRRGSLRACSS